MKLLPFILIFLFSTIALGQGHPCLMLTQEGVEQIRTQESSPLFESTLREAIATVDAAIEKGIDVPIPKDMGGGYTHEQHKLNYKLMHLAGVIYQVKDDKKYAEFVKEMLFGYAEMYPTLPIHPTDRSYSTGRIFWQCLNDSNWLVYTSQAYDCIYNYLSKKDRKHLESQLFRPYADFLSVENPQFFNRVHNHSTWGNAAVGMIGIVMGDEELIDRALYGLKLSSENDLAKDNDGGFIYEQGQAKAGFFANLDHAFSPDGYYTEGPYYQRYAMTPFLLFAQGLDHKMPQLKIFEYRDNLLVNAVDALLQQTDSEGQFFAINDAQKGMSIMAPPLVNAVGVAFGVNQDPRLSAVAKVQGKVTLDQNGWAVSKAAEAGDSEGFAKRSIILRDGANGDEGALGILRPKSNPSDFAVLFKATAQGLGHGHYDKLGYIIYDGATEVLQDYGAARWVNIDQKAGGRYLKENKTWAKQTVAHNALVVDQKSHFGGKYDVATTHHSDLLYLTEGEDWVIAKGKETNAYEDVDFTRTLIVWEYDAEKKPLVVDIISAEANDAHSYDLPFQYSGQIMQTSIPLVQVDPIVMGKKHGYQHLYEEARSVAEDGSFTMNYFKERKFYSIHTVTNSDDTLIHARIGANDPEFNLRKDPLLIQRRTGASETFVSVVESHGIYSPVSEVPLNPYSAITGLSKVMENEQYLGIAIDFKDKKALMLVSKTATDERGEHKVKIGDKVYNWNGPLSFHQTIEH